MPTTLTQWIRQPGGREMRRTPPSSGLIAFKGRSVSADRVVCYRDHKTKYENALAQGMTHKIWVATNGPKTRRAHSAADGQERPIGLAFDVDGEKLFLPCDPDASIEQTANCRCHVEYVRRPETIATSISPAGRAFIKSEEKLMLGIYDDGVVNDTIGYGHKITAQEASDGTFRGGISKAEAERIFDRDIASVERDLARLVDVPLTQNQYDALASLVFNVGASKVAGYNLRKALNGGDYLRAAHEFLDIVWAYDNKTGKYKKMDGLKKRRKRENRKFLTP